MRESLDITETEKLFHISKPSFNREIPLFSVYNPDYNGEYVPDWADEPRDWYMWVPQGEELHALDGFPAESHYFGKTSERQDDIIFQFMNFITQRLSYPSIMEPVSRIFEDIHNLGACITKLALYEEHPSAYDIGQRRLIISEVEYIYTVCRSLYDLFQEVIASTWEIAQVEGANQLPPTKFAGIALNGDDPVPADQLEDDYGLTPSLAKFYETEAEKFAEIRNFRDDILHRGKTIELIYITEDGYAIDSDFEPFSNFDVWDEDNFLENDLAPLWPPLAYVINHTLGVLDRFIAALKQELAFLPLIAPGYKVFTRGNFMKNISHLPALIEDDVWGEGVKEMLDEPPEDNVTSS